MGSVSQGLPKGIPNCLKKRQLLNSQVLSPDLCREYGSKFLELGWREDALEFFKKGGVAEVWRRLAERALALGKLHFARRAFELAGDDGKTGMVAGLIAGQPMGGDQTTDN